MVLMPWTCLSRSSHVLDSVDVKILEVGEYLLVFSLFHEKLHIVIKVSKGRRIRLLFKICLFSFRVIHLIMRLLDSSFSLNQLDSNKIDQCYSESIFTHSFILLALDKSPQVLAHSSLLFLSPLLFTQKTEPSENFDHLFIGEVPIFLVSSSLIVLAFFLSHPLNDQREILFELRYHIFVHLVVFELLFLWVISDFVQFLLLFYVLFLQSLGIFIENQVGVMLGLLNLSWRTIGFLLDFLLLIHLIESFISRFRLPLGHLLLNDLL